MLACGSAMRMRHLSVTLSVEFADADTAQKGIISPIPITDPIIGASLVVLADCGFTIADVAVHGAKLEIPAFT